MGIEIWLGRERLVLLSNEVRQDWCYEWLVGHALLFDSEVALIKRRC